MWKREQPEPIDLEHVMTEPPPAAASAVRPVTRPAAPSSTPSSTPSTGKCSTLGATLRFKGDLVADEDLVIQGQVEGSILHTRSVTIGAQGRMHGDTRARRIVVEGSIDGNLYAIESITIRSGATVRGDVFAPRVSVDEGARLSGRIDMDNAPAVPTVNMQLPGTPEPAVRELTEHQVDDVLTGS
jgi:cytoskeletal protein CcmA (bactofilin family)